VRQFALGCENCFVLRHSAGRIRIRPSCKCTRYRFRLQLFLYSDTYREISYQYRFTSWQATGKNDAWSSAYCGLRRVSPIAPTPAASIATRRPCSRTENVNPSRNLYQFIDPGGMNGLVGRGTCELTPCPRMLRIGLYGLYGLYGWAEIRTRVSRS
jgi:hypothetical protein